MDSRSIIEGSVKFRDGKKWKSRWCVMSKLSPVADCLHLQLYRDSKDRYKHGLTKASLSLQHFLGLESGFTLDKESNTIAIICQDVTVVLAFDTRERLIQWQVKIYGNLPEGQQYLIQISSSPSKAKISNGPARLHIQDGKFCMTTGVPPKLSGFWELKHLRRFGVVDGKFCFEGGSLCGKGEGAYVLLTDQGDEISRSMQLASEGRLEVKRKPLMRNATVHDSPCHKPVNLSSDNPLSDASCADICVRGIHDNLRHNTGRHSQLTEDIPWPSVEIQSELFGHGDTSSLGDLTADCPGHRNGSVWLPERTLGRCSSCIGKLGLPSRPSTAANTPASITFNPIWISDDSKNASCFNTIMNEEFIQNSIMVRHNCTTTTTTSKFNNTMIDKCEMSQSLHCHYSQVDNFDQDIIACRASTPQPRKPTSLTFRSASQSPPRPPPSRPPKPPKYKTMTEISSNTKLTPKKINKPPMALPSEEKLCSCKHQEKDFNLDPCSSSSLKQKIDELIIPHHYDIPRNIKIPNNQFPPAANYDIPPPAIPVVCKCSSPNTKKITEQHMVQNVIPCSLNCQHCLELRTQLNPILKYNLTPSNSKVTIPVRFEPIRLYEGSRRGVIPKAEFRDHSCTSSTTDNKIPVYATVDLSKKLNRRKSVSIIANEDSSSLMNNNNNNNNDWNDYTNIRFTNEEDNYYERMKNLSYMNLEFTNSLRYYENVKELLPNCISNLSNDDNRIECLNIDMGNRLESELSTSFPRSIPIRVCTKCGHSNTVDPLVNERLSTDNDRIESTVSPLKTRRNNREKCLVKSASNPNITFEEQIDRCRKNSEAINHKYLDGNGNNETDNVVSNNVIDRNESIPAKIIDDDAERNNHHGKNIRSGINDNVVERRKAQSPSSSVCNGIRKLPNVVCSSKSCSSSSNRDSSSSNDSGFSNGSLKFHGQDYNDFEMPPTTAISSERHYAIDRKSNAREITCSMSRSKSSDVIKDLSFHMHRNLPPIPPKSSSAGAELPLCLNKQKCCKDSRSTSSATSDMSDYIETLSYSSYGSSDVTDNLRAHQTAVTTLRPRSGKEYQKIDRISILQANISQLKDSLNSGQNPSAIVLDKGESSSGYSSTDTVTQHR